MGLLMAAQKGCSPHLTPPCPAKNKPCPAPPCRQGKMGGQRRLQIPRLRFDAPFHCAHKFCLKRGIKKEKFIVWPCVNILMIILNFVKGHFYLDFIHSFIH